MNSKFFVPFETAKQLKEKGYPQAWATMYYDFALGKVYFLTDRESASCVVEGDEDSPVFEDLSKSYYAAPTYHEVVDWLEGKGINIGSGKTYGKWYCSIDNNFDDLTTELYSTREEALNSAIISALEML